MLASEPVSVWSIWAKLRMGTLEIIDYAVMSAEIAMFVGAHLSGTS